MKICEGVESFFSHTLSLKPLLHRLCHVPLPTLLGTTHPTSPMSTPVLPLPGHSSAELFRELP